MGISSLPYGYLVTAGKGKGPSGTLADVPAGVEGWTQDLELSCFDQFLPPAFAC
jgi:hypothetical protein